jgi:predicted dehydrogenase
LSDHSDTRVLVIGAGSIGARHAANLRRAGVRVAVMDPDEARAEAVCGAEPVPFDLDALAGYDGLVIASPTTFHLDQTVVALATDAHVLVEKPLAASSGGLDKVVEQGKGRLMVGYNLRLHEPLERLVGWVRDGRAGHPLAVRVWFGFFLPSWRPAVDYRTTYSARAELGGGILLDAIHELDLLVWMLGDRFDVAGAVVDRIGDLEIDVEDTVRAVLRHMDGAVVDVELDYLSRQYRRGVEVIGSEATLRLDWAHEELVIETGERRETTSTASPIDRSYEREAERFLAFVRGDAIPPVDGTTGAASVRLADQIREAARWPGVPRSDDS